jgi:hypothetical protein
MIDVPVEIQREGVTSSVDPNLGRFAGASGSK